MSFPRLVPIPLKPGWNIYFPNVKDKKKTNFLGFLPRKHEHWQERGNQEQEKAQEEDDKELPNTDQKQ